jgi:hypothetical protein
MFKVGIADLSSYILDILLGMIESRKVTFYEIYLHIKTKSKVASTERRIQSFFSDFIFDYTIVASFLLSLMPFGKLSLCIDRTEQTLPDDTLVNLNVIF